MHNTIQFWPTVLLSAGAYKWCLEVLHTAAKATEQAASVRDSCHNVTCTIVNRILIGTPPLSVSAYQWIWNHGHKYQSWLNRLRRSVRSSCCLSSMRNAVSSYWLILCVSTCWWMFRSLAQKLLKLWNRWLPLFVLLVFASILCARMLQLWLLKIILQCTLNPTFLTSTINWGRTASLVMFCSDSRNWITQGKNLYM